MSRQCDRKVWFPAKTYGYGWSFPCCRQGWLVLLGYVILAVGGTVFIDPAGHPGGYLAYISALSVLLGVVCRIKGEAPAWRWGRKE